VLKINVDPEIYLVDEHVRTLTTVRMHRILLWCVEINKPGNTFNASIFHFCLIV
jgi:hypothetical protein